MKKWNLLLLAVCSVAWILAGCGKKAEPGQEDTVPGQDVSQETEEPASQETEENAQESAKPGMVRSSITNEWILEALEAQRPIAVMMPTDKAAQPQYGIGRAEVLYECMEEGDMSRQMAIINDWQDLEQIGNIRSCRLYYIYWAMEWDPILVHFGGVFYMRDVIASGNVHNISGTYSDGTPETKSPGADAFFRTRDRNAPHNAYVSADSLLKAMDSLQYPMQHRDSYVSEHFQFADEPNTLEDALEAQDAKLVDLADCFPATQSHLEYNAKDGLYYKYLYGKKQIDAATDEQLTFKNIIIQTANYEVLDAKGYLGFRVHDIHKEGYYITNGRAIPITWQKTEEFGVTRYFDKNGNEIELNTGRTYIAIVQDDTMPVIK